MLPACGMTLDAILKIRNALFQMLGADFRLVVFMAAVTGIGGKAARMTRGTCGAAAMPQRESM